MRHPKIALCSDFRALCHFEPSLTFCWSKGENALLCIRCSMNALQNATLYYYTVLTTVFFGINVVYRGLCKKIRYLVPNYFRVAWVKL